MSSFKKELKYLSKLWHIFDTYSIYATTASTSLLPCDAEKLYIYSLHKVKNPKARLLNLDLAYFKVFQFQVKRMAEPVGFGIIPILDKDIIIRYTPVSLVATHPQATKEAVKDSTITSIFKNQHLEIVRMSCGVEIITDLGAKFGMYLNR